jgi:hypothetical protein
LRRAVKTLPATGLHARTLLEIRQSGFVMDDAAKENALAVELLACLADPDRDTRWRGLRGALDLVARSVA